MRRNAREAGTMCVALVRAHSNGARAQGCVTALPRSRICTDGSSLGRSEAQHLRHAVSTWSRTRIDLMRSMKTRPSSILESIAFLVVLVASNAALALTTLTVTVSSDNNPGSIGEVGDLRYSL